jgi:hypothetical protein
MRSVLSEAHCLQQAKECLDEAERSPANRTSLLRMAQYWLTLSREVADTELVDEHSSSYRQQHDDVGRVRSRYILQ